MVFVYIIKCYGNVEAMRDLVLVFVCGGKCQVDKEIGLS